MAFRKTDAVVHVTAPDIRSVVYRIVGTSPFVQARFSEKARNEMANKMKKGSQAGKETGKREARDFDADYRAAMHVSEEGWIGFPASGMRAALISACRLVGFVMTRAKLSLFVEPDGMDAKDAIPLVRLYGEPEMYIAPVRNSSGVADLRSRPMWRKWSAFVTISYDAAQFDVTDVTNLLLRVGRQVGIGEGRPDSRQSTGMGWGLFSIENPQEQEPPQS